MGSLRGFRGEYLGLAVAIGISMDIGDIAGVEEYPYQDWVLDAIGEAVPGATVWGKYSSLASWAAGAVVWGWRVRSGVLGTAERPPLRG